MNYAEALAVDLADVDASIVVTAGEPAAFVGTDCPTVWIWVARVEDAAIFQEGCTVLSRVTVAYRIDSCYTETEGEIPATTHEADAAVFEELIRQVWCALVDGKDTGTLLGLGSCEQVILLPLIIGQRQGGVVSASGAVTADHDCLAS